MTQRYAQILGTTIVIAVVLLTLFGPYVTPRNPRERTVVTKTATGYRAPPYDIGTSGFILGSDQFGRDMLSRMMAGTQPTMLTILVVATLRVIIGSAIGIINAFGHRMIAYFMHIIMRIITYLPQLFGALFVLVLAGNNPTLSIFIGALVWSGWGDVAQLVQQRIHEFRQLPVYEAAVSSGAPTQSILVRHIRRHLAPLWGMMWLREMSNSLGLLAMLGFLGYFVGGASWIIVAGDAIPVGARSADLPELGQLLATSFERVLHPQPMFLVGGYIAIILLGFNLLGDVVRVQLSYLPHHAAFGRWQRIVFDVEWWLSKLPKWQIVLLSSLIIGGMFGLLIEQRPSATQQLQSPPAPIIWRESEHWRDARADAAGSLRGQLHQHAPQVTTLAPPPAKLTSVALGNADGDVVAYSETPSLVIYDGHTRTWQTHQLKFRPVGNPALTSTDEIVVVGAQGFVAHYDFEGRQLRTYTVTTRAIATASATIGPDDAVYITVNDRIEAFDSTGTWKWATPKVLLFGEPQAQISPDGTLIFLGSEAFDITDGARLTMFAPPKSNDFENPLLISGADGYVYQRRGHQLTQLWVENLVPHPRTILGWNASQVTMFYPEQTGVTAQGIGWMIYKGFGGIGRFVWLPPDQEAIQMPIDATAKIMMVADDGQILACTQIECVSHTIGKEDPLWRIRIPKGAEDLLGISVINYPHTILTTRSLLISLSDNQP